MIKTLKKSDICDQVFLIQDGEQGNYRLLDGEDLLAMAGTQQESEPIFQRICAHLAAGAYLNEISRPACRGGGTLRRISSRIKGVGLKKGLLSLGAASLLVWALTVDILPKNAVPKMASAGATASPAKEVLTFGDPLLAPIANPGGAVATPKSADEIDIASYQFKPKLEAIKTQAPQLSCDN